MSETRTIAVDYLARVEGEGAMFLAIEDGQVKDLKFKIFEPPRFIEALLRGRSYTDPIDITARICGICPVAYQTSAANAIEAAFGMTIPTSIRDLRRILYCGEWIESHALHVYLLHAPDFLGYESGIHLAADHRDLVEMGPKLKKIGNNLVSVIGGREIHPVNPRVGGFYRSPSRSELDALTADLEWALQASLDTVELVSGFTFPDFESDYEFVALSRPDEYAIVDGRITSNRGIDIDVTEWASVFAESHVEWSNALHATVIERGAYMTGPLARYSLGSEKLHHQAREAASKAGLGATCANPFKSIVVRAVEMVHACVEALQLIDSYRPPHPSFVAPTPRRSVGHGATEAPRGICYHRYGFDAEGVITDCQIVPPTSQNQLRIEQDLREFVPPHAHLSDDALQWELEKAIRNYDPCISCATHFLDLTVERR